ncbi:MAG TPA: AAA family ATPase [Methylomirabilota bacterium]|nr:AAA family ATPase [Methylomirabilota bacterium]
MYLTFYGLREKPFNATPDPKFLYMSSGHREALSQLVYGTQERKGFIVLTGKVGTGKTTLLHALCQRLNGQCAISFVVNSGLRFDELLEYVLEDLGVTKAGESRAQRLMALNTFLIERERIGQNTVLIIDEAQNLDVATLEQVRLLSNFETPTSKLLQILLVGQPELKTHLNLPELRQLKQRVGLRCQIQPLTPEAIRSYIRTRLRIAGGQDLSLFSDAAIDRISNYSGGIPRLINIVCDHCLLFGYAEQQRRIDRQIVTRAIEYLEDGTRATMQDKQVRGSRARLCLRWGLGALVSGVLGVMAILAVRSQTAALIIQSLRELVIP